MTIFSQVSRADAWRVQSQLGPWSMEVPQGQFVSFSCGSNRGIANHKYAVRRVLLNPVSQIRDALFGICSVCTQERINSGLSFFFWYLT